MKYLIVSDIHGSLPRLNKVLDFWEHGGYDQLIVLGDILNYGPRNGVPEGLDAQGIVARLNPLADRIIAVRGNCDSEVDQMLLQFPMMGDYTLVVDEGIRFFLTHGHIYNKVSMPKGKHHVMLYGHTHKPEIMEQDGVIICNTGSITFPKDGNPPTFATYEDGCLRLRSIDGKVLKEVQMMAKE